LLITDVLRFFLKDARDEEPVISRGREFKILIGNRELQDFSST